MRFLILLHLSMLFFVLPSLAQNNTFPVNGNVGLGTTSPETKLDIRGGLSVAGENPIKGINNFRNSLQIKAPSNGAIIFNPGETTEMMFGFHSNGNFYWGTGTNYVMQLSTTGDARIYKTLAIGSNLRPGSILSVNGKISAKEVEVSINNWPDYVFEENYDLKSLTEIEAFIKANKHLPGIPKAVDIKENGVELGEMNRKLLEKVEELTLHLIEERKRSALQDRKIESQEQRIQALEKNLIEY